MCRSATKCDALTTYSLRLNGRRRQKLLCIHVQPDALLHLLIGSDQACMMPVTVCRIEGSVAAVCMALSVNDICDAQIEVEAYHNLQQLQGKHVPKLLGYGHCGQGFCVATSYIEACLKRCWLVLIVSHSADSIT